MRRPTLAITLAFLSLITATFPSRAAVTLYSDRAAFETAIGPHVTYTFDTDQGFPAAPGEVPSFGPCVATSGSFTGPPAIARVFPDAATNQTLSGLWTETFTDQLFVSLATPQYALGFEEYTAGILPGMIAVYFTGPSGGYSAVYGVDTAPSFDAPSFFGIISDDPITMLSIRSYGDSKGQRYKGIDDFILMPEPSLAGVWLCVFISLVGRRRS